jgi:hypothetical protein
MAPTHSMNLQRPDPTTGKITALNQNRAGIGMWYDY